jgi:hypothetical protein
MPANRRPRFARDFPDSPALDALVEAFARGDYARVRADGARLAESPHEKESVRRAARALIERTGPDPLSASLLVIAGVLLAALWSYWTAYGKPPVGGAPSAPQDHPPGVGERR